MTSPNPQRWPFERRRHWDVFLDGGLVKDLGTLTRIAYGTTGSQERECTARHVLNDTRVFRDIPEELIAECKRELGLPEEI
ncbi:hypothetical protein ACBJ59_62290 [Nonomuraea sp. MTCD27]|uniref:hypothetical protein n=1 Tax=Nonomuraea sp. MTCD27 TaxID=1676747 RepID=UPI0035C18FD0